nr:MAG TPA: hypothetical protein [Caudoviricetes sp.]
MCFYVVALNLSFKTPLNHEPCHDLYSYTSIALKCILSLISLH